MTEEPSDPQQKPTEELAIDLYADLRKLAKRHLATLRPDRLIQTTGLVHDAYLKMSAFHTSTHWNDESHFLSAASHTMRRVVIDRFRKARALKRGKGCQQVAIELDLLAERGSTDSETATTQAMWEALDEGIKQLEQEDPIVADFAKLRIYSGLSVAEAGAKLGFSRSHSYELWNCLCDWFRNWDES